ncbi:Zn-dependent hydrolase [Spirabiliibacterium falconis]|uniref:Zn-dependent hydrolase n=1 Tax=Spirabiliibacterium falconis TaxID=572023 RepID=UPI001AACAE47|nr:Zn-dependent hydrolase [Spirabiliibacterium falconis]MBE2893757.1 Zn-dependent hydrolase [Spirabiliibacterium falconis]
MNIKRMRTMIEKIATFSCHPHNITRLAYSPEDIQARDYVLSIAQQNGLTTRIDAIGNAFIRRDGRDNNLPAVAFGSHLDSVIDAGKFDGVLGCIAGFEILLQLQENQIPTHRPLELIIFACEESSRFRFATLGSKVMCNVVSHEKLASLSDEQGISFPDAIQQAGFNLGNIESARCKPQHYHAFLELHIEQGPLLEQEHKTIGIVTGIAAPIRAIARIYGQADHSGATAMQYRHDALLAGCEIALALEQSAVNAKHSSVATVGQMSAKPGVMNVVPGFCELLIDIRGCHLDARESILTALQQKITTIETTRGVRIELEIISKDGPVMLDSALQDELIRQCERLNYRYELMPSGAGHDAMHMTLICPSAMIFIPSIKGISHNPLENSHWHDVLAGANLLKETVLSIANTTAL